MKLLHLLYLLVFIFISYVFTVTNSGCAQIGAISGGKKDTIAPKLSNANPQLLSTNFTGNKIVFTFDEYIGEMQDLQSNVLVSPYPKRFPEIRSKLKTVTVKLKDTLLDNTTYAINFGNAIKDVNEGNILKDFTYVFSTGKTIDSLTFSGKVQIAETGKFDSTIIVMLYKNANDSSVLQKKPNYIAKVNSNGSFTFINLPPGDFSIYALKDGDGSKTYNSKTELFAFIGKPITVGSNNDSLLLYAFADEKETKHSTESTSKAKTKISKKLSFTPFAAGEKQDLKKDLIIKFSSALKNFDSTKISLTDSSNKPIAASFTLDSNKIICKTKWIEDLDYRLVINKTAVRDSTDSTLAKTDTLKFKTKRESDYGNVLLHFNKINFAKHPVIQFVKEGEVKESFAITAKDWSNKLFAPGEYEIRILYDDNNNGKWDPGNYKKKLQPEKVIALPKKFTVKENWDNESDINL